MDCAITILKNVGMVALVMGAAILGCAGIIAAALGTAWLFGAADNALLVGSLSLLYMIVGFGIYAGVEDCRGY